jgi:hypothetical protein
MAKRQKRTKNVGRRRKPKEEEKARKRGSIHKLQGKGTQVCLACLGGGWMQICTLIPSSRDFVSVPSNCFIAPMDIERERKGSLCEWGAVWGSGEGQGPLNVSCLRDSSYERRW